MLIGPDGTRERFIESGEEGGERSGNGYRMRALGVQHTTPIALGRSVADDSGAKLGCTVHCPGDEKLAELGSVLDTSFLKSKAGTWASMTSRPWRTAVPTCG